MTRPADRTAPRVQLEQSMVVRLVRTIMLLSLAMFVVCLVPSVSRSVPDVVRVVVLANLPLLGAAVLSFLRARSDATAAKTWNWIGLALTFWLVGGLVEAAGEVGWIALGPLSFADAFWLLFYPCMAAGLFGRLRRRSFDRRMAVDVIVCALGALAIESAIALGPLLDHFAGNPSTIVVALFYPIADLALAVFVIFGLGWRRSLVWRYITCGLGLFFLADTIFLVLETRTGYSPGSSLDVFWLAGAAAIGLGTWSDFASVSNSYREHNAVVAPYVFAVCALGVLIVDRFHRLHPVSVVMAVVTLVLTVAQSGLAVREIRALAESRREARTDELTELPNRRSFTEWIAETLERAASTSSPLAILMVDLDGFKVVNDTLGHHTGDELLRLVSRRFQGTLAPGDVLARLGGDEFGIVVHPQPVAGWAFEAGMRLCQALEERFDLDGLRLQASGSIGIALYPDHGDSSSVLLQRADVAMYEAKRAGGGVRFYSTTFDRNSREQLQRLEDLREAIEHDQLTLFYQPKVRFSDGSLVGVEGLVRWQHPVRGLLTPDQFLPLAVSGGLLPHLTRKVLNIAVHQAGRWLFEGYEISVAVNAGSADLVDENLPVLIKELLDRYAVPAHMLTIEITEDAVIADPVRTAEVVATIRGLGARVAVDDFGAGYASLSHLRELEVDELKLDRSLVDGVEHSPREQALVQSAVGMAHALGLRLVAEGVETPAGWERLRALGCDVAQGYLVSRPLSAKDLRVWLQDRSAPAAPSTNRNAAVLGPATSNRKVARGRGHLSSAFPAPPVSPADRSAP